MTPEPAHGTRACYRAGCRLTPCRAANAAYEAARRKAHAAGTPPLGSLIDAATTRTLVKGMRIEGFTFVEIAKRIGLKCAQFRMHSDQVTIRKYLQIRRLYRTTMGKPNINGH